MIETAFIVYGIGAVGTAALNVCILAFVTNYLLVLRNAVLWPIFLPLLIGAWLSQ